MTLLAKSEERGRRIIAEVGKIGENLTTLRENHQRLTDRVYQIEDWSRRPFTKATVKTYIEVIQKYFRGLCPCCGETRILSKDGVRLSNLEIDHFKGVRWNKTTEGWAICEECHKQLSHGYLSRDGWVLKTFQAFQLRVSQYLKLESGQRNLF